MVGCYPSPAPVLARTEVNARSHEHTPEQNACSLITSLFVNLLTHRLDSWVWFLALVTVKIEAFRIPIVTGQNYLDTSWACACIYTCLCDTCVSVCVRAICCNRIVGTGDYRYSASFHSLSIWTFLPHVLRTHIICVQMVNGSKCLLLLSVLESRKRTLPHIISMGGICKFSLANTWQRYMT